MTSLSDLTPEQRRYLTRTLTAIAAAEAGPCPEVLAAAPALDLWRPLVSFDADPVLWGHVSGHPLLAPGPIVTSRLIALDRTAGWARTLSRWDRLAHPFAAFQNALAQDAGHSNSGLRIMAYDFGSYIPVDDPAVLDRLLAAHVTCARAYEAEERTGQ